MGLNRFCSSCAFWDRPDKYESESYCYADPVVVEMPGNRFCSRHKTSKEFNNLTKKDLGYE